MNDMVINWSQSQTGRVELVPTKLHSMIQKLCGQIIHSCIPLVIHTFVPDGVSGLICFNIG
jgi:hypothetical protein